MNTISEQIITLPINPERHHGAPRHIIIATWCWVISVSILILMSHTGLVTMIHGILALYCLIIILFRPLREAPFPLLLVTMGPNENLIFLTALLFFMRALFSGKIYLAKNTSGYLFIFLLIVIISSTLFSYATVQFKPVQTIFWAVTLLIPLTLSVMSYKLATDGNALSKYAIMLISLQLLPIIAAIPENLNTGSSDVFGGTWLDADIVGFWGTALMMGSGLLLSMGKHSCLDKRKLLLITLTGAILAAAASGKIYSVFIIVTGLLFFVTSTEFIQGLLHGKAKSVLFLLFGGLGLFLAFSAISGNLEAIKTWAGYQFEHSHKIVFLNKVFNQMDDYGYSDMLGVGPGMLGSRAANAVSADVLHKEQIHLPQSIQGAPAPEARIMAGLFDKEFQEQVRYMSANIVIPFSGIGAMKAELGWLGLIVIIGLFVVIFWPKVRFSRINRSLNISMVTVMVSLAGLSTIFLAIFETSWEQPKIMVALSVLLIALNGKSMNTLQGSTNNQHTARTGDLE